MDRLDAWTYESRVKQILTRLNITAFDQQTENLSGGQTKRIALANALITEPDLLILDEPTNHLDLEMTRWLEEYLSRTKLTLLMVTHDRYFLDRVCTEIIEIDHRQSYSYKGQLQLLPRKRQERLDAAEAQRESDRNLYRKGARLDAPPATGPRDESARPDRIVLRTGRTAAQRARNR